jgi:hypothetical protein
MILVSWSSTITIAAIPSHGVRLVLEAKWLSVAMFDI